MGSATYIEEVRAKMTVWGQAPDPFACWLLERGLKTLDVRVQRQNENALRARALVRGAPGGRRACTTRACRRTPTTRCAVEMLDGFGGMLADRAGGRRRGGRPLRCARLRLVTHATSLGGVDSLRERAALHVARAR